MKRKGEGDGIEIMQVAAERLAPWLTARGRKRSVKSGGSGTGHSSYLVIMAV